MLRTRDHHHKTIQGDYTVIRKSSYILSNTNARPLELKSLWIYTDSNKWKVVKFMNDDEKMLAGAPKIHTVNKAVTGTWSQECRKSGKGKKKHTDKRCLAHDLKKSTKFLRQFAMTGLPGFSANWILGIAPSNWVAARCPPCSDNNRKRQSSVKRFI